MHRSIAAAVAAGLAGACGAEVPRAEPTPPPQPEVVVVDCDAPAQDAPAEAPAGSAKTSHGDDAVTLAEVEHADLPGWTEDRQAEALPALLASCARLDELPDDAAVGAAPYAGTAGQWRDACAAARAVPAGDDAAARATFEREFRAYATRGRDGASGKVTGYFVAPLRAARERGGQYLFPIYARPDDLVEIQLDEFIEDGRSRRIWGRVDPDTGEVVRYGSREQIRQRLTDDDVLLWLDDPVDAIHVEIEGSGIARFEDGSEVWVGFDGKNGLRSGRNGAVMRAMRAWRKQKAGAPWTARDVETYFEIADPKLSIVFFELQRREGAIGTQQVVLTAGRSVAVDRAVIPLSAPLWLDTTAPPAPGEPPAPFRRLMVAQDTGGGIRGSVRVDVYFGADADAGKIARRVNGPGRVWVLLPRDIDVE